MKHGICLALLFVAGTGCSGSETPDSTGQTGPSAECRAPCKSAALDERVFLLQSADGFAALPGSKPILSFRDGRVGLSAGCNSLHGEFALREGSLIVGEAASTEVGCEPAEHAQDEWLAMFITSRPHITLQANTLTLRGDAAMLVFVDREVAEPDRPLVDTPWTIDSFITNDAVERFAGPLEATLLFAADGRVSFATGCNSGAGEYVMTEDQLTFRQVGSTNRACMGPPAAAEEHIMKVLTGDGAVRFEIEARRLTLMRGSVGLAAVAPQP